MRALSCSSFVLYKLPGSKTPGIIDNVQLNESLESVCETSSE